MLALYSGFGQVVVANEILDGADVVVQLFGERQRTEHFDDEEVPSCPV
jgi:hypothetical protein